MNQDKIKEMLLDIQNTELDFSVTFTGKSSKKVNGLYKTQTYEILLHNKNFKTDNQLVYTAIHEYAHHLQNEERIAQRGELAAAERARSHTTDFWARFHELLNIAEKKGYYTIGLEDDSELNELTSEIKNQIEKNGVLMQDFGRLLAKAQTLCEAAHIRFEDYIDRVLRLPRVAAKAITRIAALDINPALGYENMKLVASQPNAEKRSTAEGQFLAGKSPDMVRAAIRAKLPEPDPKVRLEQEKKRITKTIDQLTKRLEIVEGNLAKL